MHSFATALIAAALATFAGAAPVNFTPADLASTGISQVVGTETHDLRARAMASVAVVFDGLLTEIHPYTDKLAYIDDTNCTLAQITEVVASIKAPIDVAIPQLKALVGAELGVILAPVDATVGEVELTVSDIAAIVGGDIDLILGAAGDAIAVVKDNAPNLAADVEKVLADLGATVTGLVEVVLSLVDGLTEPLSVEVTPVGGVVAKLHLKDLAACLHLSL